MSRNYYNPVTMHVGAGSLASLPALVGERRVALVTFPEARGLGLIERVQSLLPGRIVRIFDQVQPNPDVAQVAGLYADFWCNPDACELIVALGGGSAIDTAKTLVPGTASRDFADLLAALADGRSFTPAHSKALIAIPTTAGTGSEVTPWATVWDAGQGRKYSLHLDCTWPEAAIVDAELMLSLPRAVTVSTGLDALSHALESIWNVNANPVSDALAVSAIEDIFTCLPLLAQHLDDLGLRSRMAEAALKAGLAFSNTKTALAHSISYEMTLAHGLPHGIACSFTLPYVLGLAWGRDAGRDAVLQRVFGAALDPAQRGLTEFLHALGIATDFAAHGVAPDARERIIATAMQGARGKNFIGAAA